jgi:crotonobetainyl-CoA:carnitine CoA-transferase CaiB-like acyl-CoA transferase
MKHEGARHAARRLIEQCDVLVENFSANVLASWGLDWETVRAWNPRLVYLTMSGCGHDGPWKDYVTYAPTVHALCGLTALTNPPGRKDLGTGMALNDHASGLTGALAVLAALDARERTGAGQHVDLSQLEVGTYLVGPAVVDRLSNERTATAVGNRDPYDDPVPNEVYPSSDGWVAVTCRDDRDWQRLCGAIDAPVLGDDGSLRTVEQRRAARAAVDAAVASWTRARPAGEAMRILQAAGVPAGKVQDARDLFETDEQLAHRDWLAHVEHFAHGRHAVDRFPARFSLSALPAHRPSPYLGEHNFEVYGELLALTEEEVAAAMGDQLFS